MDKKMIRKLKVLGIWLIFILLIWFLILNPLFKFKSNEKKMLDASKRYFELNSSELPTGTRTSTIYLKDLYRKAFLDEDLYVPFTKDACSIEDSWVKVKRINGDYKYYAYLKCGVLTSMVDHKGPEVLLNGDDSITINKGDTYNELGVKSVNDNTDGKIDISNVIINSKNVNTLKTGTYNVTYTVFDSFSNKTVKIRKVKVVSRIKNVINENTNNLGYYQGDNPSNYMYFSGMLFRIVGLDGDNVKIIADQDIANVNYSGIEKWLGDYYYEHLTDNAKKYIVDKKLSIISTDDIDKSLINNVSYLKPVTMSWTANKLDDKKAYVTRNVFFGEEYGKSYIAIDSSYNYGVRPVITIKGDLLIKSGNGTYDDPYSLGEFKTGKADQYLNTRYTGEYVIYSGYLFRIIDIDKDGTIKVISNDTLKDNGKNVETFYNIKANSNIYNPKEKGNVGYFIKNKSSQYIKTDYFVEKEITVPIYKDLPKYEKEDNTKKYKVKLSAPNMYEMFSAYSSDNENRLGSYWLINSSKTAERNMAVLDNAYMINEKSDNYQQYGIRVVGYLNKDIKIVSGRGLINNPYVISR